MTAATSASGMARQGHLDFLSMTGCKNNRSGSAATMPPGPRGSVARRIGVVSASRCVVRIGRGSDGSRCSCISSTTIEGAAPGRPAGYAGKGQRREGPANDVDEDRSRSIGAREVAFEHVDIEGKLVAFKLWRF